MPSTRGLSQGCSLQDQALEGGNCAAVGQGAAPSPWSRSERGGGRDSGRDTVTNGR